MNTKFLSAILIAVVAFAQQLSAFTFTGNGVDPIVVYAPVLASQSGEDPSAGTPGFDFPATIKIDGALAVRISATGLFTTPTAFPGYGTVTRSGNLITWTYVAPAGEHTVTFANGHGLVKSGLNKYYGYIVAWDSDNITWTPPPTTVDQAAVTISPSSSSITTGSSVTFTAAGGSGTGAYTWGGNASGSGSSKTITFNTAGTHSVTVYRDASTGYNQSNTATATINVSAPALTPTTFSIAGSFTYDGGTKAPTITPSPAGATYTTGGTTSAVNAGSYTATATATGSYTGSNTGLSWTIAKANPTVSFTNPGTKTYGAAAFGLTASANSGGAVTYSVVGGPATVSGSNCTITGAGTVTLRATAAATTNYNSATADVSFAVNKANQATVTISPVSQTVLRGSSITLSAAGGSGTGAYTWGGQASGTGTSAIASFPATGTITVEVYRAGDSNYNTSTTATATITVVDPTPVVAISPVGGVSFGGVAVSPLNGTTFADRTWTITNTGNANLVITSITTTSIADNNDFALLAINGMTPSWPVTIAPSGTATITVRFDASEYGSRIGQLKIAHNATGSETSILLTGTGLAPKAAVNWGTPQVVR